MAKKLHDIKGKHVVTLTEGRDMGSIKEVFLDPKENRVSGFLLSDKLFGDGKWANSDDIKMVGEDYVFVKTAKEVRKKKPVGRSLHDLLGIQVSTQDGKILGALMDFGTNSKWKLTDVRLSGRRKVNIDDSRDIIGEDVIVLRKGASSKVRSTKGNQPGVLERILTPERVIGIGEMLGLTDEEEKTSGRKTHTRKRSTSSGKSRSQSKKQKKTSRK